MPEIIFNPFTEEEPFDEAGITQRLDDAKDGLNSIVQNASQGGALNHHHDGSCVVFMDTKEQTQEQMHAAQGLPLAMTGPVYWNLNEANGSGDGRQEPVPNDGIWEAIGSPPPLSDDLEILFTPIQLEAADPDDRFGVTCIYVMLNAEVRWVAGAEHEPNIPFPDGNPDNTDCAVALTIQWNGYREGVGAPVDMGWFHIYQNQAPAISPDPTGFGPLDNWCRLPERKVGPTPGLQLVPGGLNDQLDIWHDVAIRTVIRKEDITLLRDLAGMPINAVGGARGAISLITTDLRQITKAMIRNANLTVIALRGVEDVP